jgi:hypothetical protein
MARDSDNCPGSLVASGSTMLAVELGGRVGAGRPALIEKKRYGVTAPPDGLWKSKGLLSRFARDRIESIVRLSLCAISLVLAPLSTSGRIVSSSAGVHGQEARRGRSVISLCPRLQR